MLDAHEIAGTVLRCQQSVRSYGLVVAAVAGQGKPRRRFADLLIAATARASQLDLYTRNADDCAGLEHLIRVVPV